MTAAKTDSLPADAPSHESVTWHAIDWRKTLSNVRRLQARIVKATQAGNGTRSEPYNVYSPTRSAVALWPSNE